MTRIGKGLGPMWDAIRSARHASRAAAAALAFSGGLCVTLGLLPVPAAPVAEAAITPQGAAATPQGTQVTVRGRHLWDPATGKPFPFRSSVTVAQTTNLVNQVVHVSWTGFTPSSGTLPYDAVGTDYPVMVTECRSLHPRYSQCFGDNNGGVANTLGTPSNAVYTVTSGNGKGQGDVDILTSIENQQLGCSLHHPCSLAIVPAQGGIPGSCNDHSQDVSGLLAIAGVDFSSPPSCSWADRIIVPLTFAPTPISCPILKANFTVIGSPMMQRAMDQWDAGLCAEKQPLSIQYDSAIPEPVAVIDALQGLNDVALTTRPAPNGSTGKRKFTYAPVAVSAVSVAFWADNPATGQPVRQMKLDPRLVAKMLTTSYNLGGGACSPGQVKGCDNSVDGNPGSIFVDPEFKRLNPGIKPPNNSGSSDEVPMVQSGESDMTYEMTRWIAANPDANAFLHGEFDPWGMHINTNYLGLKYPTQAFIPQDPFPYITHAYTPLFPASMVATDMVENWPPATSPIIDPITGNYDRLTPEPVGGRALFAILDQADAAAFRFPVAAIRNHAGRYVEPSQRSMAAALRSMVTSKNGITQQVNLGKAGPAAYPLTMVIYAMVPISGVKAAKAASIARWLDFAAGPGQVLGTAVGQLPAGFLPLPAKLRARTLKAATEVLYQTGNPKKKKKVKKTTPAPSSSISPTPPVATTPVSLPAVTPKIVTVAVKHPVGAGIARYALVAVLIGGGLAALAGLAGGVWLVPGTVGSAVIGGLRRVRTRTMTRRRKR